MKSTKIFVALFLVLAVALLGTVAMVERIEPAEIGVKQARWGGSGIRASTSVSPASTSGIASTGACTS